MQSLSGVAGTLARATGEPRFVPMVMSDHTSGLIAAQCIGFALYRREKTGKGEAIDVPMLENMASFVSSEHLGAATFDPPVGPTGDGRLLSPNYRPLPTKDGYITVRPNTNPQAFAFFDAIGRPELKTDPRFDSAGLAHRRMPPPTSRCQGEASPRRRRTEWVEMFDKLDVPAARYNSIDDLLTDPHLKDVGFFQHEDHPSEGRIRRTRLANIFSGGARAIENHAPSSANIRARSWRKPVTARRRSTRCWAPAPPATNGRSPSISTRCMIAVLAHRIVEHDAVHGGAVVPHHDSRRPCQTWPKWCCGLRASAPSSSSSASLSARSSPTMRSCRLGLR